jgi:hypothetical protein
MRLNLEGYTEREVLEYVLAGLERERDSSMAKIAALRAQMGEAPGKSPKRPGKAAPVVISRTPKAAKTGRRELSPEARKRIADAQHKRWAKVNKAKKAAAKVRIPLVEADAEEMAQAG